MVMLSARFSSAGSNKWPLCAVWHWTKGGSMCCTFFSGQTPCHPRRYSYVWQIAVRYLMPELAGKQLCSKLHHTVSEAFVNTFGAYAGWAHTVLFIAELSSFQEMLPSDLQFSRKNKGGKS